MDNEKRLPTLIAEGFRDLFYIWRQELRAIFRDSGVMIFFFLVPLAYPVIYALIYNPETVRDVPLVVVDQSGSQRSREFIRRVDATPDVRVVATCGSIEDARRLVDSKQAYGILLFTSDFNRDLAAGRQATVSLYTDMSLLLHYKALLLATTEVSLDMGREIRAARTPQSTDELQQIYVAPIPYESVALFNPANGFASFLLPAVLILIIQQTLVLGICMLGGTAREQSRFHHLVPLDRRFRGTLRVLLGKAFAYVIIYIPVCLWTLVVVPRIFAYPSVGNPWDALLFLLPYLLASIFFAMILSGFMRTRESGMMLFVFMSVILLFLSGAFDRLRDSQRRGEGIVPRTLVSEFPIFGRGYPSVPIALRLHEAVIAPRIRVCWASRCEPPSVSVGRGWRLGFVSLERVSSPP